MNSRCDDEYMEIVGRLRSRKCINVRWYDYLQYDLGSL